MPSVSVRLLCGMFARLNDDLVGRVGNGFGCCTVVQFLCQIVQRDEHQFGAIHPPY